MKRADVILPPHSMTAKDISKTFIISGDAQHSYRLACTYYGKEAHIIASIQGISTQAARIDAKATCQNCDDKKSNEDSDARSTLWVV